MRKTLILSLVFGLGSAAVIAETTNTCSIRAGRTEEKMSIDWERGDCVAGQHCHQGNSDMLWSKWSGVTPQDLEHEGAADRCSHESRSGRDALRRNRSRCRPARDLLLHAGSRIC